MSSNITAALKAQSDKNAAAEAKRQAAAAFKQSLMAMDTFRKVTHTLLPSLHKFSLLSTHLLRRHLLKHTFLCLIRSHYRTQLHDNTRFRAYHHRTWKG